MSNERAFEERSAEDQKRVGKLCRSQIRKVVENAGAEMGCEGVVTAWIVVAEFASRDEEGDPFKTLWIEHAYHDDTPLVPWMYKGMMLELAEVTSCD